MSASVSVVIPTYNVGELVREAVGSVLRQTHGDVEVLVVDDGSTDDSIASISDLRDSRLRIIRQNNRGLSAARNTGFRHSTGTYVAFLDADDFWFEPKLERTLPLLRHHVAVGTRMRYVGESGRLARGFAGQDPRDHHDLLQAALFMPFPISSTVFHRHVVEAAGDFDESLQQVEDLDFLYRVARLGSVGWSSEPLGAYRLRAGSMSAAKFSEQRRWARFVAERVRVRDAGGDLTWSEFASADRLDPALRRAERGAAHYRRSGLLLANGDLRGVWAMTQALAVTPRYTVGRLRRQLRR